MITTLQNSRLREIQLLGKNPIPLRITTTSIPFKLPSNWQNRAGPLGLDWPQQMVSYSEGSR